MAFSKFTRSEKTDILTPQQHQEAEAALRRMGKTSAKDLSPEQRAELRNSVENQQ